MLSLFPFSLPRPQVFSFRSLPKSWIPGCSPSRRRAGRIRSGDLDAAIDAFEAALTVEPGSVAVLLPLADATRRQGLQGKALHYYRVALNRDPRNVAALAGEGVALAEKGATEKAARNLARLQTLCGATCAETQALATAIAKGPTGTRMVTAEAAATKPMSEN
ncbi:tetratricopeptide repeat protein [Novosphingobium panipatense]